MEPKYLGQAPHTPGGHLALVGEGAEARVLLTNTVYPVGPKAARDSKPKYRIKGKTAPDPASRGAGNTCSVAVRCVRCVQVFNWEGVWLALSSRCWKLVGFWK